MLLVSYDESCDVSEHGVGNTDINELVKLCLIALLYSSIHPSIFLSI